MSCDSADSLMRAAHRFMLPTLFKACVKCLLENIETSNVIHVLGLSKLFDEATLKRHCLEFIRQNARAVLMPTGKEILSASWNTMEAILQMNTIPAKKIDIYKTCIAWAEHQLRIASSTGNPTDEQIRTVLDDLLYLIRFPTMEPFEFAEISDDRKVLTDDEKASIYKFLVTKEGSNLRFCTEQRLCEETWVDRTVTCATGAWRTAPQVDAIAFKTNHDIQLTGIGLYTGDDSAGYDADVEILQSKNCLFRKSCKVPSTKDANQFKVTVDVPIPIDVGVVYLVKVWSSRDIGHYGQQCQQVCKSGKVVFTFLTHPGSPTSTTAIFGQIPRIYFCY